MVFDLLSIIFIDLIFDFSDFDVEQCEQLLLLVDMELIEYLCLVLNDLVIIVVMMVGEVLDQVGVWV